MQIFLQRLKRVVVVPVQESDQDLMFWLSEEASFACNHAMIHTIVTVSDTFHDRLALCDRHTATVIANFL